jgi:hypothetical protein
MPVVLELGWGGIKISVYFKDHSPPHVHAHVGKADAQIEIATGKALRSRGFNATTLRKIGDFVKRHQQYLQEQWDDYKA